MPDINFAEDWIIGNETQDGSLEIVHKDSGNTYKLTDIGELQSTSLSTDEQYITEQDLSTLSSSEKENWRVYHHNGTATINLSDGGTTTSRGYYFWDDSNSAWRQVAVNADTVDGKHASDFVDITGDTFEGQVRIDTNTTEDALLELFTDSGAAVYPTIHMGPDGDNGVRIEQEPDTETAQIYSVAGGTTTQLASIDTANGLINEINRVKEINAGSHDADNYESVYRVYRNGNLVGFIDQSSSDIRLKASDSAADAEVINSDNDGMAIRSGTGNADFDGDLEINTGNQLNNDLGDSYLEFDEEENISDTGSVSIFGGDHKGLAVIGASDGASALVHIVANSVRIINSGGGADWTTTSGNDGTHNIYHDGSNYVVENQSGGTVTYDATAIGE